MQFLLLFKRDSTTDQILGHMREWDWWMDSLRQKGIWKNAFPVGRGNVVTSTEVKSYQHHFLDFSGFLVIDVDSLESATTIAQSAPHLINGGQVEVREILSDWK